MILFRFSPSKISSVKPNRLVFIDKSLSPENRMEAAAGKGNPSSKDKEIKQVLSEPNIASPPVDEMTDAELSEVGVPDASEAYPEGGFNEDDVRDYREKVSAHFGPDTAEFLMFVKSASGGAERILTAMRLEESSDKSDKATE